MGRSPKASPGPQEVAALQAPNLKPDRELSRRHRLPPCSLVKGAAQCLGELSSCVCQGDAACVITLQPA